MKHDLYEANALTHFTFILYVLVLFWNSYLTFNHPTEKYKKTLCSVFYCENVV